MSQTFILKLATDSLASNAKKIGVTIEQLLKIEIEVDANIYKTSTNNSLSLSYQINLPSITLAEQLQWPSWRKDKVSFDDYLWEQTCLECFITSDAKSYVEINASPDGRYALYQFADYRNPLALPPLPLLKKDSSDRARIFWNELKSSQIGSTTYQRHFSLSLDAVLSNFLTDNSETLIHPCVILFFADTALYFAPAHATPADFHNRQYWSILQLQ